MRQPAPPFAIAVGLLSSLAAAWPVTAAPAHRGPAQVCGAIASVALPAVEGAETRVDAAEYVDVARGAPGSALPSHCRVDGRISGTIGFVLRVPANWNRRLLMQGCRALCGYHATADCDDALARGYATLTTDTGHTASLVDARWAAGNARAREDYAWRAVHLVALAGKDLVARIGGERPRYSYLRGCSNGGRQGLLEAERFPETFDGVIAGAPLVPGDGVLHLAWSARENLDASGRPLLQKSDLELLHALVIAACGDADGLVADPRDCRIDPQDPRFGRGTAAERWTPAQRLAVRRLYDGPRTRDGRALTAGGPQPGSERAWTSFVAPAGEASVFATLATDYLRYLAFDEPPPPGYTFRDLDFDRDPPRLVATARAGRATGDLRAFAARGGKAIVYHGWADESVVPGNSLAYASAVRAHLRERADEAFRLYMLPGVGHCTQSPGPGRVDWLTVLEDWVERGRPPAALTGSGASPQSPGRTVTRLHFPEIPYRTADPGR